MGCMHALGGVFRIAAGLNALDERSGFSMLYIRICVNDSHNALKHSSFTLGLQIRTSPKVNPATPVSCLEVVR